MDDEEDEFRPRIVPSLLKPASRLGLQVSGAARKLGAKVTATGLNTAHKVTNGFLLRAVRTPQVTNVHILDLPALLLLGGSCSYAAASPYTAINGLAPVGNRDDFSPPGYTGDGLAVTGKTWLGIWAPGDPPAKDAAEAVLTYCHMQPVVAGSYVILGHMRIPTQFSYRYIDDVDVASTFTDANTVRVGCAYRYPREALGSLTAPAGSTYLALNSFWVSEGDLPSGWRFLPRRYSSGRTNLNAILQPLHDWPCWTPGAAVIPATGLDGDTTDQFMIAIQGAKQLTNTWSVNFGNAYTIDAYDAFGERGLLLLRGELDTTALPQTPTQLYAQLASTTVVLPTDIDQAGLHPYPPNIGGSYVDGDPYEGMIAQGDNFGPVRATWAYFQQPQVQRCTDGFVAFANYRAPYKKDTPSDYTGDPATTGAGSTAGFGRDLLTLYAVLTMPPAGGCLALKGDAWNPRAGVLADDYPELLPTIADQDPDTATVPWIVGSESIDRTASDGTVTTTAYALVWEEHRNRLGAITFPGAAEYPNDNIHDFRSYYESFSAGGNWTLYSLESGPTPERTVLTGDTVAPLFGPLMCQDLLFPGAGAGSSSQIDYDQPQPHLWPTYASTYCMGNEKLVTAGIDLDIQLTVGVWLEGKANSGSPSIVGHEVTDPHSVYCVVVDLTDGTVARKGEITTRTELWDYCHITVAQPEIAATDTTALKPAVLLATMFNYAPKANGVAPSTAGETEVFVSVDGGDTWKLYVTDMGAPNGSFLVGNQLWSNDVTERFDEDLAQ